MRSAYLFLAAVAASMLFVIGIAYCVTACHPVPVAVKAELTYGAELQACTAQAKLTDAGLAGSKACEVEVDKRWHIPKDGGEQ